jgi:hypothetical protein
MRSFLTMFLLFAGFSLLILGALLVVSRLLPSESLRQQSPPLVIVAVGLMLGIIGWLMRRTALARLFSGSVERRGV